MSSVAVCSEVQRDAGLRTITVERPPGNVLDVATCEDLGHALEEAAHDTRAKLLVIRGAGRNFSFGASVEEHLPEQAQGMLRSLGDVVERLLKFPYPTLAAVQGRCLGGGLELALACGLLVLEDSAVLAAPEIQLGVFAPAATVLLESRLPAAVAEDLLLTGREMGAAEALSMGLCNRVVAAGGLDDAVKHWASESFAPRSAASLRVATAARREEAHRAVARLRDLERRYLKQLLTLHDGTEGIRAFLEKREPAWKDR